MKRIKVGDKVFVNSGKDKGKTGVVKSVDYCVMRATVEGVSLIKKHIKPGKNVKHPNGGIVEELGALHLSKLNLVDPKSGKPTRVKFLVKQEGSVAVKQRVSVKSGAVIG